MTDPSGVRPPKFYTLEPYERASPRWELTPWWMFWRSKKWRGFYYDQCGTFYGYFYVTEYQLALIALEEEFGRA